MGIWSRKKSIPLADFSGYGFAAIDRYAYLIGGIIRPSLSTLEEIRNPYVVIYDSLNDIWSIKSYVPDNFEKIEICVSVGDIIYCFAKLGSLTNCYSYNTINNTWTVLQSTFYTTRLSGATSHGLTVHCNNKIYHMPDNILTFNIVVYDIALNQWFQYGTTPFNTNPAGAAVIKNDIYLIGGSTGWGQEPETIDKVYIYNTITQSWRNAPSMLEDKDWFPCPVYESEIYAIGGIRFRPNELGSYLFDIQIFNPNLNEWRYGEGAPADFYGTRTHPAVCNRIIVFASGSNYMVLDMRTAKITNAIPTAGFINRVIANIFTWTLESGTALIPQQSAIYQWRIRNSSNINIINVGTNQNVIVPANTFPSAEIEWRVNATNILGDQSDFTEWYLLTTIDIKPNKPTGLYPNSGSRDGTKPIQFSWIHNSPLSTPQFAFELQTTYDNGYTWKTLSDKVITATTQFIAAANTILPTDITGRLGWRVRTYNIDDVASDWSDTAFFIVHPAPQTPTWISVETGQSRPLCRWISLGQVGFQLQVLSGETVLFDSGEIFGTQTEYRITDFLPNGIFTFRVRIKNIRGLYSEWANRAASINARRSLNITLRGVPIDGGAALDFDVELRS